MPPKTADRAGPFVVPKPATRAAALAVEDVDRLASQFKPMWEVGEEDTPGSAEEVSSSQLEEVKPPGPPPPPPAREDPNLIWLKGPGSRGSDGASSLAIACVPVAPPQPTAYTIVDEPVVVTAAGIRVRVLTAEDLQTFPEAGTKQFSETATTLDHGASALAPRPVRKGGGTSQTLPDGVSPEQLQQGMELAAQLQQMTRNTPDAGATLRLDRAQLFPEAVRSSAQPALFEESPTAIQPKRNTRPIVFASIGVLGLIVLLAVGKMFLGGSSEPASSGVPLPKEPPRLATSPPTTEPAASTLPLAPSTATAPATATVSAVVATPPVVASTPAPTTTAKVVDVNSLAPPPKATSHETSSGSGTSSSPATAPASKSKSKGGIVRETPF